MIIYFVALGLVYALGRLQGYHAGVRRAYGMGYRMAVLTTRRWRR